MSARDLDGQARRGTKWSPPTQRRIDPHSLAKRAAIHSLSCQVQAAKVEVLKTDVRMTQQIRLAICIPGGAGPTQCGRQQAGTQRLGPRLMTNSMGGPDPHRIPIPLR